VVCGDYLDPTNLFGLLQQKGAIVFFDHPPP
jgi:hypothetical protein